MKTTVVLSWLLLVLLFQSHRISSHKTTLPKESGGFHRLPQQPQGGQPLQGLNETSELSEVSRRGGEREDVGAKVSHKGEGGVAGTAGGGSGEDHKSPNGANSDISRDPRRGHHSAATPMQVPCISHTSTIPAGVCLILGLLFFC